MSERPILFSGPMVRAILEGRKSQTRRVCRPMQSGHPVYSVDDDGRIWYDDGMQQRYRSPYGEPGDTLWVRESWQTAVEGPPPLRALYVTPPAIGEMKVLYRATDDDGLSAQGFRWRPSIFMPRALSRITLEVTDVRVERLQDITPADAWQEGVRPAEVPANAGDGTIDPPDSESIVLDAFRDGWDTRNAKRGYGWQTNPFVWCISFRNLLEGNHG